MKGIFLNNFNGFVLRAVLKATLILAASLPLFAVNAKAQELNHKNLSDIAPVLDYTVTGNVITAWHITSQGENNEVVNIHLLRAREAVIAARETLIMPALDV